MTTSNDSFKYQKALLLVTTTCEYKIVETVVTHIIPEFKNVKFLEK